MPVQTWVCEFCGEDVPPFEFELMGLSRVIRRRYCWCNGAGHARARDIQADRDKKGWSLIINSGLQAGKRAKMTFVNWDTERNEPWSLQVVTPAREYVENVASDGKNWLYLHGPYGVGKTHLAIAALRAIAFERMWTPHLVVWPDHCSAVQQSWKQDRGEAGPTEGQLWSQMQTADILLIDDIDKRDPTPWAMGKLYEVIDRRQMRERPTIITANHSITELAQLWASKRKPEHVRDTGAAILSRIAGQLWGVVEFGGKDQRWA